jgi:ABC-type transport system involved in multi-copper enzyme maturation permease subunit
MNPLVKKEIRLLLPVWFAVMMLEIVLPWVGKMQDTAIGMAPVFFFFGMILLSVDSFGREFSLGTFSSLMAQPVVRRRIWRTKITVLLLASALIFAAYFASCYQQLHLMLMDNPSMRHPGEIGTWRLNLLLDFRNMMAISVAIMFIALAGGLWTTLLFRQVAAAFWISFLAPVGLFMGIVFWLPSSFADNEHLFMPVLYGLAGLYVLAGLWLAHRLFHRAQDAGWAGGIIAFSRWRYFESGSQSLVSTRHRKPFIALVKKEFQLQSISWFCAAALLALHLAVILMRYFHGSFERDSIASATSEFFWTIWLIMPLIISSTVVAEERRLGVLEGQFCLAASRRLQFTLKFFLTIISGLLLGGFMPLLLEGIAAAVGAANPDFGFYYDKDSAVSLFVVVGLALGLSLAGFFASTLAKSFLHAMGIAVVVIVGCCSLIALAALLQSLARNIWNPRLTILIAALTVIIVAIYLPFRNFKYVEEPGRIWRRNAFAVTGAILFIFIFSAALYNRAWEVFEPAEPAHGPAKFSMMSPPNLHTDSYGTLLVGLPDGRMWFDYLTDSGGGGGGLKGLWLDFVNPLSVRAAEPSRFVAGSNWISATARRIDIELEAKEANPHGDNHVVGYLDSVGIQSDGTLWISDYSTNRAWTGNKMNLFGGDKNWRQIVRSYRGVLLLKTNGTLWRWGTNRVDWSRWQENWPTLRSELIYQIGTNSDWKELSVSRSGLIRKLDGSVWTLRINDRTLQEEFHRETNMDQVSFKTLSYGGDNAMAYTRPDGTLWVRLRYQHYGTNFDSGFVQIGKQANWIAVAFNYPHLVALKSDGSLWQWVGNFLNTEILTGRLEQPPTRLGIHNDWVAIATCWGNTITLAADGSLWLWPHLEYYPEPTFIKLPKQKLLGNIFSKTE